MNFIIDNEKYLKATFIIIYIEKIGNDGWILVFMRLMQVHC